MPQTRPRRTLSTENPYMYGPTLVSKALVLGIVLPAKVELLDDQASRTCTEYPYGDLTWD
jgi:hypothetical protein